MSVNKPSKIDVPDKAADKSGKRESLLERAGGAFGLGGLNPAKVPSKLPGDEAKRMPTPAKPKVEAQPAPAPQPVPQQQMQMPHPGMMQAGMMHPGMAQAKPRKPARPEATGPQVHFKGTRHEVDRIHLAENGFINPDGGTSALIEEFRIIKRQLIATAKDEETAKARRILISSAHSGEGKTFCSVNLALAMAGERGSEVLLVDADFANPSVMSAFGLENGPGLMDALADPKINVEDLVVGTDVPGLWLLPAGERTTRDSEYLASERTWEVLGRLTRSAPERMLVFDSPPALAASPAAELAKHVGQSLLVARADQTGQASIEDALDLLSACADVRLLLNDVTFSPSGRKFGTYYGTGE